MKFKDGDPQAQRQQTTSKEKGKAGEEKKRVVCRTGNILLSLSRTLSLFHFLSLSLSLVTLPGGLCEGRLSRQLMNM